jgi:hypothetical protein
MSENGRIARFVKAARSLLLMQLAAALLASALAIWAVTAVWELAAERDRLRAQLDSVQSRPETAQTETPLSDNPMLNEVRPPALLPIAIPVMQAPEDVNMILPGPAAVPPVTNQVTEPVPETPPAGVDCTADPSRPGCGSVRWRPPVRQRPGARPDPDPPQPKEETPPRPD